MLFNSIEYILFFPLVAFIYYIIPPKYRWILLLAASYIFYMSWKPEYLLLILSVTLINYFLGKRIDLESSLKRKRIYLSVSLVSCLGILVYFKYENFLASTLQTLIYFLGIEWKVPVLDIILPVGISFFTFQALSYTIDVYRDKARSENHFGIFSLYVAFFPQLVAGPIERPSRLLPQFYKHLSFDYATARKGFHLILIGMFKKVVVADRLALYVDQVYSAPALHDGITLVVATIFFSMQIYCDFSGYTDIAIGSANILGFDLMQNFKRPYLAQSLREFWQRWHISLSTWFRDYLYIPLGGNTVRLDRWCMNILIVFAVSGLWHGAAWTFVIWGTIHGVALIVERFVLRKFLSGKVHFTTLRYPRISNMLAILYTFSTVSFAWIFFRASSFNDATLIIHKIFTHWGRLYIGSISTFLYALIGLTAVVTYDIHQEWIRERIKIFNNENGIVRHFAYAFILVLILAVGVLDEGQFIYFQF